MSPLLYYILSAVCGAILSWVALGGNKAKLNRLEMASRKDQAAIKDILSEFSQFKNEASNQLKSKDAEITKLKSKAPKSKASLPDIITKAQEKEIKHWKSRAAELETQLRNTATKGQANNTKELEALHTEVEILLDKIDQKDKQLKGLSKSLKEQDDLTELEGTLLKKINKLKKKNKKYKKLLKAESKKTTEKIEVTEALDIDKIVKLFNQGKLTTKTKKVIKSKK